MSTPLPLGRVALFVDGSNFYHTLRDLGLHVDYRRLLEYFQTQGYLVRASYYTALLDGDLTPAWLVRLTDWLAYNGYAVVTKRAKLFRRRTTDEGGEVRWVQEVKGDIGIDLAVDALKAVQRLGCRVVVVRSERTADSTVADELRRQADQFVELTTIADHIGMADRDA